MHKSISLDPTYTGSIQTLAVKALSDHSPTAQRSVAISLGEILGMINQAERLVRLRDDPPAASWSGGHLSNVRV